MKQKNIIIISIISLIITGIIFYIVKNSYGFDIIEENNNIIYVANDGNDTKNNGSFDSPYLTIEKALRTAKDNTTILVKEGKYIFYTPISIRQKNNIIIKPYKNDKVIFTTSHEINLSDYKCNENTNKVEENLKENIACIDIESYINDLNYKDSALKQYLSIEGNKELLLSSFSNPKYITSNRKDITLYAGDEELGIARYPNDNKYLLIDKVINSSKSEFFIENINERNWDLEYNQSIYTLGYWTYNWQTMYKYVDLYKDEANSNLTKVKLKEPITTQALFRGQRVAFYNIFEEMDNPGEYYYDKNNKQLYVYKNEYIKNNNKVEFSFDYLNSKSNSVDINRALFYLEGTNNFSIKNIEFKNIYTSVVTGQSSVKQDNNGYYIVSKPLENTLVENNIFKNINMDVINLKGGENNLIRNNYFGNLNNSAITLYEYVTDNSKSYRYDLTTQNNQIINNKIEKFNKSNTEKPGIIIQGVGNVVAHNEINDSSHHAINFYGNNHKIEYNEIYNVCTDLDDGAAVYSGGNLTFSGNEIQNNYFHDIITKLNDNILENERQVFDIAYGAFAIYTDDNQAFVNVRNNIFNNVDTAYHVNGGSYNTFYNNIIINAKYGFSHHYSASSIDISKIHEIVSSPFYDENSWASSNKILKENILDNYDGGYLTNYVKNIKGLVVKNNLAVGNSNDDNINNCDDVQEKDYAINIFYEKPSESIYSPSLEKNEINYSDDVCEKNVRTNRYADKKYYRYGIQDAYTNNFEIFKEYEKDELNLNLDLVHEYLPEFEHIHFNRIGRNKIIKIKLNVDDVKKQYIQNYEQLDLNGGYLEAYYSDGSKKNIKLDKTKVLGFDNAKLGKKELTVIYDNEQIKFPVEIIKKSPVGIKIDKKPNKSKYIKDIDNLELTGGIITILYNDGTNEKINLTNAKVSGFDNKSLGNKTITVEYLNFSTSFEVTIIEKKATNLTIIQLPDKIEYIQNSEQLNLNGIIIELSYNDGKKEIIDIKDKRLKISGFDNKTLGNKEINLEIEELYTKFNVNIVSRIIKDVSIIKLPSKLKYVKDTENLDLTGGILEILYNDNSKDRISMTNKSVEVRGFHNTTLGKKNIEVKYQGHKKVFNIDIVTPDIKEIKIVSLPIKNKYIKNYEELDLTGGILEIIYVNNTKDNIEMTNENIKVSGFNNKELGNNKIELIYLNNKLEFDIEIIDKSIQEIKLITLPIKTKYIQYFEELDLTGGILEIIYNDNTTDKLSLTNKDVKVKNFNNRELGVTKLIIEYKGKQTDFEVKVIEQENNFKNSLFNLNNNLIVYNAFLSALAFIMIYIIVYQSIKKKQNSLK